MKTIHPILGTLLGLIKSYSVSSAERLFFVSFVLDGIHRNTGAGTARMKEEGFGEKGPVLK